MSLVIHNNGPLIAAADYWQSEYERAGKCFLSINDRAFRLLLPRSLESHLPDMAAGKLAVVSTPRSPGRFAMELLLDDGTDNPYALHLSAGQIATLPARSDDGRTDLEFTVWTCPQAGDQPHMAQRRPAAYRSVPRLPWLRPWGG